MSESRREHLVELAIETRLQLTDAASSLIFVLATLPCFDVRLVHHLFGNEAVAPLTELIDSVCMIEQVTGSNRLAVTPLLAEALRCSADPQQALESANTSERASQWYFGEDHYLTGIEVLLADHRWTEATVAIEKYQLPLYDRAEPSIVRDLLRRIPGVPTMSPPETAVLYVAGCITAGDHRNAAFALSRAPLSSPETTDPIRAAAALATGYLGALEARPEGALAGAERAIEILNGLSPEQPMPHLFGVSSVALYHRFALVVAGRNLTLLYRWEAALECLSAAKAMGPDDPIVGFASHAYLAWTLGLMGELDRATVEANQALAAAEFWPPFEQLAIEPRLALAEVHLARGACTEAKTQASLSENAARTLRATSQITHSLLTSAAAALRLGESDMVLTILDQLPGAVYGLASQRAQGLRARAYLRLDEVHTAIGVLQDTPVGIHSVVAHAELCAATDDVRRSKAVLQWRAPNSPAATIAANVAQALIHSQTGSGSNAQAAIDRAVGISQIHRSWGWLDELPTDVRFLVQVPDRTRHPDATSEPQKGNRGSLTPRELEVLQRLSGPGPMAAVASDLFVSLNTLKTHLRALYRKLDTHSRIGAIEAARRRGLLR